MCSCEADLRCWGFTRFFARSSWPAPLSRPSPGGGGHLVGGYPADLGARPQAPSSRGRGARPAAVSRVPCILAPPLVLRQLDFLGRVRLLGCSPLGTCLIARSVIRWKEVSPPSIGYHVPMAEHRLHQPHIVVRIPRVLYVDGQPLLVVQPDEQLHVPCPCLHPRHGGSNDRENLPCKGGPQRLSPPLHRRGSPEYCHRRMRSSLIADEI
jgi:hypothetical protein